MDNLIYWIWLSLSCTPDTATFPKLLSRFTSAKEIFEATDKEISTCVGYNTSDRTSLLNKNLDEAEKVYNFCKKHNVGIVEYASELYPKSLKTISTPPVLLYYRGVLPDFNNSFLVSVVGTRAISSYGRKAAFRTSYDLARAGATVVSGMALGIDGVAMAGALTAQKAVVAVLGSGIDICYPAQHLTLAREIVKTGCVLTEYAPGTKPSKYNFPRRNRIISGLASATLVVEGRENSGALITARRAREQGRAVYAFPGNVESPNSEVSNLLIKTGAKMCTRSEDILSDFSKEYKCINTFLLSNDVKVNIMEALTRYSVVATCPDDDIFTPTFSRKKYSQNNDNNSFESSSGGLVEQESSQTPMIDFDADTIKIYKSIPFDEECDIESLVTDKLPLREVMKSLLKLEMGQFVLMLPGEKVRRKPK